ncbi:MAG TPA: ATP-binding protein [Thermoanaerobaculia bacterium]|nr:ATP-binding protein [Thermoanaerobaculia bacterium]
MTRIADAAGARYRALFETTPDGIMVVDDAGTYVDLNQAMCAMLGGTYEELIGRHFRDFMPPDRLEEAFAAFAALQSEGALAVEFPIRRTDGRILNLEWRSRSNFLPGLHFCIARDLSPREEAQRALRESEERYRAFVANSSEAIWRIELEEPVPTALEPDEQIDRYYRYGYLAECNEVMAAMYGFSTSAEIVGARLGDLVVREDPNNIEYLRAFIASGYRLLDAESHEVDREGNEKHFVNNLIGVVENGAVLRAWGTQRDITGQRTTERERAALVERLEFLADVTAVLGSSLDYEETLASVAAAAVPRFADWCFVDIVDAAGHVERVAVQHSDPRQVELCIGMERRYPTPPETPVGPPHTIRTGVTQSYDIDSALLAAHAKGEEHRRLLEALHFHAGLVVPLAARGRTLGALAFALSESERKFTEEDVRLAEDLGRRAGLALDNARLYGELERANRAKDEFLAMLSHELRTPMTATLGWGTMLQGGLDAAGTRTAADAIVQATRAQAHLIDDLLDISRIVSGKMQLAVRPILLADAIDAAIETVRPAAEAKQIAMEIHRDAGIRLHGDPARLQQVFWNLLSNAVKFTPRGGRVSISVTSDADSARVVVHDNGEGIDAELLPYIFDRFRQGESGASRKFGGLGLGLSIARNLVELHGGTLTAASAGRGQGAEFTVLLPIGASEGDVASVRAVDSPPQPLHGVSLLLVEDDPSTRAMLEMALRRFGATVTAAGTAEEAVETLQGTRFDVVVSDIGLPGQDGCALLQRIRAAGDHTPAIALTAYASPTERERALAAGFRSWLAKPVDLERLAAEVLRTIG